MKPRILVDVKKRSAPSIWRAAEKRVNLNSGRNIRIPIFTFFKMVIILLATASFVFGSVTAPTGKGLAAQNDAERKALESQLGALEKEIAEHEAKIETYKKQGKNLQSEIKKLEEKVAKLNLQIKAINLSLSKLDQEINQTQKQIKKTEDDLESNKDSLAQMLQALSETDRSTLLEVLFKNPELSDFFNDINGLEALQSNLRIILGKIVEMREDLIDQNEVLGLQRSDTSALKEFQNTQKEIIRKTREEKTNLLKITKGKESEYQKIVKEKKKTAAEIRKQIFRLLGGGEMEFEEAYGLAKMAEKATGVRAALLLAVLDRESALGKNVGKCDYKTAMHPKRDIPVFLAIVDELGLKGNLEDGAIKVSCANSDGAYGGAMGPAQFIPSTWNLYKSRVAGISGNSPPSPWNNADAFIATALYLKDAGADGGSIKKEREAAARYYAGARWERYLWTYGDRVIVQAQQFQDDIDVLNS